MLTNGLICSLVVLLVYSWVPLSSLDTRKPLLS